MRTTMWISFAVAFVFGFILWRDLANVRAAQRREAVNRILRSLAPVNHGNQPARMDEMEYYRPMGAA